MVRILEELVAIKRKDSRASGKEAGILKSTSYVVSMNR